MLDSLPVMKGLHGFVRGSWDAAIIDELIQQADDIVIGKMHNNAFWRTDLEEVLQERGVDQLSVPGWGRMSVWRARRRTRSRMTGRSLWWRMRPLR